LKEKINQFIGDYKHKLSQIIEKTSTEDLTRMILLIHEAFKSNKTLFICGNGGAAASSLHMQADLAFYIRHVTTFRPKIVNLVSNTSLITAISNDISYEEVFVEQLKGVSNEGDILLSMSASGESENLIRATNYANSHGMKSISIVGFSGGRLKTISDTVVHTECKQGDYGFAEDMHLIVSHILVNGLISSGLIQNISPQK